MRRRTSNKKVKMSPGRKRFLTGLAAVGFTGLLVCMIIGIYVLSDMIGKINGDVIVDLEFYKQNQDQTTIIYANNAEGEPEEMIRLHGEQNRVWVDIEDMSEWMGKAAVSLEDKRFYKHHGVDWVRTILGVVKSGFEQGGSTITQQLIKNLTGEDGRSIKRKYNEILAALNFEKNYDDKEVILEAYLNTLYLSHGCYGVKTAAETYFGKDIKDLNLAECASLVAITQEPAKYDPLWNPDANKKRQEYCLSSMLEQGVITQEQYDEAVAYELIFTNSEKYVEQNKDDEDNSAINNQIQSYYVDFIISEVIKDLKANGYSAYEARKMIYSGGLRIYSAVDLRVQEAVENIYVQRKGFPSERVKKGESPAQSAVTIMDYQGRVVAMVGGAGEKTENRGFNRATSAIRQPGSSIKPLSVYTAAIEENYATWSSHIKNYGITWKGQLWPQNYGGSHGAPDWYVTTQYALAISYNTIPAQLLMKMGFATSYSYLTEKFHITTLREDDGKNPSPMVLGGTGGGVTTLQMAAAFASFGNGGKYYKPYCYYKVTDSTGNNIILQNNTEGEQIITPETAYVMNEMMQTVVTGSMGTGRNYGVSGFPTYMKTGTSGTSDYDFDRWCVGGTPYYVAAVWYGYDENKSMGGSSSNPAGTIFKNVMNATHKGLAKKSFETYTDQVVQRAYCTNSGLLAGDGCYSKAMGWYKVSNLPATCKNCNGKPAEEPTAPSENPATSESTTAAQSTTQPPAVEPTAPPAEETPAA